jgi:hypothetical protein
MHHVMCLKRVITVESLLLIVTTSLVGGNNDLVHGPTSPGPGPSSAPGTKQHEVFNPGYSRTSSTNSIPQKTFDMQSQPANGAGLRSK